MLNKKQIFWIIASVIVLGVLSLAARFFISGNEKDTGKDFGPGNYWICRDGFWDEFGNPSEPKPTTPCETAAPSPSQTSVGLANPASVNCINKGGQLEMKTDESGGQYGVCKFSDGSECEEWKFFREECKTGDSKK